MDSILVNLEALDAVVIDFAKSENLIEDSTTSSSPSSSYRSRLLIRQIRRSVEAGDIDVALDLLRVHAPCTLDDHRLLFRLQKQKFIELLRKGTQEDRDDAVNCLRAALSPCALDAYPEAYEEFKHVLLAFVYDKDDQNSPVAYEVDIQALAHAVELTRQGAVDSLKFAKGDLFQAFQNELCCMRLNASVLDELVHEYCVYRGIVDSASAYLPAMKVISGPADVNKSGSRCCSLQIDSTEVDCGGSKVPDNEPSANNPHTDDSPEDQVDATSTQTTEINERYPSETTGNYEDCSTGGTHQPDSFKVLQRNRNHGFGETSKRKRWRGRHEKIGCVSQVLSGSSREEAGSLFTVDALMYREDKYDMVLAMKELVCRGMALEVVEEINAMDPNFFVQNPN